MIKLKSILLENNILISRRNKEERLKYYRASLYKKIKKYIKNGCKGDLDLNQLAIDKLPDELKRIGGGLYLARTNITSLPNGLTVEGNLDLDNTPIESLPDGLTVVGYLYLCNLNIKSLPNRLRVYGSLYLGNTPISFKYTKDEIKQMIITQGGLVKNIFI